MPHYTLTREQLLKDLHAAYYEARKHKRQKPYQLRFEKELTRNLQELCEELWSRTYQARPSTCFIISDPKKREVFAADFRDRVVHHLYYRYVHVMFERTFVRDSYSCIKNRGTHDGIARLRQHILRESQNYTQPCYVLKIDIRGYFMHINRKKLLAIALNALEKMGNHRVSVHACKRWQELVDMNFVAYLTHELVLLNPVDGCCMIGKQADWEGLPPEKSLFHAQEECGLPIGNLTSQLFSNVYLNVFDQYVKRQLGCRHYGRYVDDAYFVSGDREQLREYIPQIRQFLMTELGLPLHEGKLCLVDARQGVSFLGAFVKPGRVYIDQASLRRMRLKLENLSFVRNPKQLQAKVNSHLGVLGHYRTWHIQRELFFHIDLLWKYGVLTRGKTGYKYRLLGFNPM